MSKQKPVRRINTMHLVYGKTDGKFCKTCDHLISSKGTMYMDRVVFKCTKSKMSHGAATDWRVGWDACGLYVEAEEKK